MREVVLESENLTDNNPGIETNIENEGRTRRRLKYNKPLSAFSVKKSQSRTAKTAGVSTPNSSLAIPFGSFVKKVNEKHEDADQGSSVVIGTLDENQFESNTKNSVTCSPTQHSTSGLCRHSNSRAIIATGKCDSHHQATKCTYAPSGMATKSGTSTNIDKPCMINFSNIQEVQNADVVAVVKGSHSQRISQTMVQNSELDVKSNVGIHADKAVARNVGDADGDEFSEKNFGVQNDTVLISALQSQSVENPFIPKMMSRPINGEHYNIYADKCGTDSSTQGSTPVLTDINCLQCVTSFNSDVFSRATQNEFFNGNFIHPPASSANIMANWDGNDTVKETLSENTDTKTLSPQCYCDANRLDILRMFSKQNKCVSFSDSSNSDMTSQMTFPLNDVNKLENGIFVEKDKIYLYPPDSPDCDTQSTKALIDEDVSKTRQGFSDSAITQVQTHGVTFPLRKNSKDVLHGYFVVPFFPRKDKFTRRQLVQLVAVMVLGFCLVVGILLWVLSPILFRFS